MSNDQDNKKRHHQHGNGVFIAILVYSIIPYLRQKVQENRYFTSFSAVIHNIFQPVDNIDRLRACYSDFICPAGMIVPMILQCISIIAYILITF